MDPDLERLKQHLPLLEYLQRHNWTPRRRSARQEFVGLCPLHPDTHPSFYVNACKNLFYCHGCGHGGDLIRFVELFLHVSFRQSVAHLQQESAARARSATAAELLAQTTAFYQLQLHRHPEAMQYLAQRGLRDSALIEELGIGYAPGGNLRRHLAAHGYSFDLLLHAGLIDNQGRDAFCLRVIFPVPPAWPDREPLRPQYWSGLSASIAAAFQGWPVCLGVRQPLLHCDSGGRAVRPGCAMAVRLSQHHIRHWHSSDIRSAGSALRSAWPFDLHRLRSG